MINLYVKQVIVLKVAGRRTDVHVDDNRHLPKFWLRPKNPEEADSMAPSVAPSMMAGPRKMSLKKVS